MHIPNNTALDAQHSQNPCTKNYANQTSKSILTFAAQNNTRQIRHTYT